jgi:hypothetical protein
MEDKANPALNPSLEPGSRFHNRMLNKAFAVLLLLLPSLFPLACVLFARATLVALH